MGIVVIALGRYFFLFGFATWSPVRPTSKPFTTDATWCINRGAMRVVVEQHGVLSVVKGVGKFVRLFDVLI